MYREIWLGVVTAGLVCAQSSAPHPSLISLKQNADEKTVAWLKLTQMLDAKTAGLLPCDLKITVALTEVSKASDARLEAVAEYLKAALDRASGAHSAARQLLADQTETSFNRKFLEMERTETAQERAAIDGQISQLVASSITRQELAASETALRDVALVVDARNVLLARQLAQEGAREESLADLVEQLKIREQTARDAAAAYQNEADQWKAYYAARLDRAKAECVATAPAAAKRRPTVGKK